MKQCIRLGLMVSLFLQSSAHAVNPVPGFYVGIFGAISHGPSSEHIVFEEFLPNNVPPQNVLMTGTANNSLVGGGGGAVLGYRLQNWRFEAEAFYNWNGIGTLSVDSCTLESPTVQTPTGDCTGAFRTYQQGFNGSIATMYGMANVFYDFINYQTDSPVAPYLGLGIGESKLTMRTNFVNTVMPSTNPPSMGDKMSVTSPAAQVIVGIGYFMDDFAWAGLDFRYLTTKTIDNFNNLSMTDTSSMMASVDKRRYGLSIVNINVNLAFDKG